MANIATNTVGRGVNIFAVRDVIQFFSATAVNTGSFLRWVAPCNGRFIGINANCDGAPAGNSVIDILKKTGAAAAGAYTTIYSTTANRPNIASGNTGEYTVPAMPDVPTFLKGDCFDFQIITTATGTNFMVAFAIGMP